MRSESSDVGVTWPTCQGPFDGNNLLPADLRPELEIAWEHAITGAYGDGLVVGGNGLVFVPFGGICGHALNLVDGRTLWESERCRSYELTCEFAGGFVWCSEERRGRGVFGVFRTSCESGQTETQTVPCYVPMGLFERDGVLFFRQRDGAFAVEDETLVEAHVRFHGGLRCGVEFGSFGGDLQGAGASLGRRDPTSGEIAWSIPDDAYRERFVSVGDDILVSHARDPNSRQKELRVRSTADGALLWSIPTEIELEHVFRWSIGEKRAFEITGGKVSARDALTGELLWERRSPDDVKLETNIIVTGPVLWVGGNKPKHGSVIALDAASGEVIGSTKLNGRFARRQSLALLDKTLICRMGRKIIALRGTGA